MDLIFNRKLSDLKLIVLFVLIFCILDVHSIHLRKRSKKLQLHTPLKTQQRVDLVVERPPKIKMLKRLTRYFIQGHTAKITLIFHASRQISIRWFKKESGETLQGSEIPGFFPLQGDEKYTVSYLKAGDVIAYTMGIPNFKEQEWPIVFETVISMVDGSMQYNLRTQVDTTHRRKLTEIDSPEWDTYPARMTYFEEQENWQFVCQAFVPHELERQEVNSFNELEMNRFPVDFGIEPGNDLFTAGRLIGDTDPWNETTIREQHDDDPLIILGKRRPVREHAIYDIKMTTTNAILDLAGVYQCVLKRQPATSYIDKSYALGTVLQKETENIPNIRTQAIMIPCDFDLYNEGTRSLTIEPNKPACLRCRGRGQPEVGLYHADSGRNGRPVAERDASAREYLNVREAGIREVMYVFRNPRNSLNGRYVCKTHSVDNAHSDTFAFTITVL